MNELHDYYTELNKRCCYITEPKDLLRHILRGMEDEEVPLSSVAVAEYLESKPIIKSNGYPYTSQEIEEILDEATGSPYEDDEHIVQLKKIFPSAGNENKYAIEELYSYPYF